MNQHYEPGYDPGFCADTEPARLCSHCGYTIDKGNPADLCEVCLDDSHDYCPVCGSGCTDRDPDCPQCGALDDDPDRGVCYEPDRWIPGEENPPKEDY